MSSPAWPARPELVLSGCFRGGSGGAERAKVGPGSAARAPGGERFLCPTPATPPFPLYSRGALAFQNPWLFPCVPCPCGPTGQQPSLSVLVRWLRHPCLCLREALGDRPLCPSPSAFLPLLPPSLPSLRALTRPGLDGKSQDSFCLLGSTAVTVALGVPRFMFTKRFPQPPQSVPAGPGGRQNRRNHLHLFGR